MRRPGPLTILIALAVLVATTAPPTTATPVEPAVIVTASADEAVTVAAVQFEVSEARLRSLAAMHEEIDRLVQRATRLYEADVVVFPEYLNVFLLATRYPEALRGADDLYAALAGIAASTPRAHPVDAPATPAGRADPATPRRVLVEQAGWIADRTLAMWSAIADRHDVVLVAGTLFARAGDDRFATATRSPARSDAPRTDTGLRNRLLVFDPDGELVYTQDKVYLTPVEADVLGLEPGRLADAAPVLVDGVEIGFTICRDTFFDSWAGRLGGVDLWIDLRANGEPYSDEVYRRFLGTLPERVATTDASAGLNASLTGEFLGHVWAGPSYAVAADGTRIAASDAPVGTQITALRLTRRGRQWVPAPVSGADAGAPTGKR